jgi:DNA-binding response OmpR family regulator
MKREVLLAEDDDNFGLVLKVFLEMNDYAVTLCKNGKEAIEAVSSHTFDICILDIMMPHSDGFTVGTSIKSLQPKTPFVYLTAKALKEDQLKAYEIGAVDYLIKPFDPEILLVKLNLLLERNTPEGMPPETQFAIGRYVFDYNSRTLAFAEKTEKLSPKEADLLRMLCLKQGEVVTHQDVLLAIWGKNDYFTKQSMNVFISKLRKYLGYDPAMPITIENIHGKGFVLRVEE